jgi:AraC-like DNA-binding protein
MIDATEDIDGVERRSQVVESQPDAGRLSDLAARDILMRVAHEMRQPLSALTEAITVLTQEADRSRREHACRVLERQCARLSRLVEDLLVVARSGRALPGGSIQIAGDGERRGTEVPLKLPRVTQQMLSAGSDASRTSAAHQHVRRMLDRIEQSYSEPITLRSLATELHRQSAYLGGMFRRVVGVSVHEWLTTVRLDRASALIREGVKVEAVSLLVGYRSKKNFYRQFKRRFGTTPFEHRNSAPHAHT